VNAARTIEVPERLRVMVTLARLLERLEGSSQPMSADQYRAVARHLAQELAVTPQDATLDAVLGLFPAAAEMYENLHYDQAGLCRHDLERSLNSEAAARAALQQAARRSA